MQVSSLIRTCCCKCQACGLRAIPKTSDLLFSGITICSGCFNTVGGEWGSMRWETPPFIDPNTSYTVTRHSPCYWSYHRDFDPVNGSLRFFRETDCEVNQQSLQHVLALDVIVVAKVDGWYVEMRYLLGRPDIGQYNLIHTPIFYSAADGTPCADLASGSNTLACGHMDLSEGTNGMSYSGASEGVVSISVGSP